MKKRFAIVGGDRRQLCLARLLEEDGHTVLTACLGAEGDVSPASAAAEADCVILPLPVSRDGVHLHTPLWGEALALEALWELLPGGEQVVCGGNVSPALRERGILDYFRREEVQIQNAVPTAEGAIAAAMAELRQTLHRLPCLVLGYGRIGRVLSHRLAGLGAQVTVAARRLPDLAWIDAFGYTPLPMGELEGQLDRFSLIFNTAPAPLLTRRQLERLRPGCLVVDLASEPGGVDFAAAGALGITALQARGLPGKAAPVTAAAALRGAVYHILEERGEPT